MYLDKIVSSMTPYIIEERQLMWLRWMFFEIDDGQDYVFGTAINDSVANVIQAQLLFLQSTDAKRDIQMYINSGWRRICRIGNLRYHAVYYPMLPPFVRVAASMGAVLLCAGEKANAQHYPIRE